MTGSITIEEVRRWARVYRTTAAKQYRQRALSAFHRHDALAQIDTLNQLTQREDFVVVGIRNEIHFLCKRAATEGQ